jgi:hypothetical protein
MKEACPKAIIKQPIILPTKRTRTSSLPALLTKPQILEQTHSPTAAVLSYAISDFPNSKNQKKKKSN